MQEPSVPFSIASIPAWTPTPSEAELLLPRAMASYGVPVLDWERPGASGLLLSVGAGLMLATMDALPCIRWAVDLGGGKPYPKLGDALVWADRLVSVVVVHAWFSVTAPSTLRASLLSLRRVPLVVRSNMTLGSHFQAADTPPLGSFAELVRAVEAAVNPVTSSHTPNAATSIR